jgi:hypothetical protein
VPATIDVGDLPTSLRATGHRGSTRSIAVAPLRIADEVLTKHLIGACNWIKKYEAWGSV